MQSTWYPALWVHFKTSLGFSGSNLGISEVIPFVYSLFCWINYIKLFWSTLKQFFQQPEFSIYHKANRTTHNKHWINFHQGKLKIVKINYNLKNHLLAMKVNTGPILQSLWQRLKQFIKGKDWTSSTARNQIHGCDLQSFEQGSVFYFFTLLHNCKNAKKI